jgi:hypothetical protein
LSAIVQKEELLRQEKLKNLEKYGTKLGRSSKTLAAESSNDQLQQGAIKKKSEKPKLKPGKIDYFEASNKSYSRTGSFFLNINIHKNLDSIQTEYNPLMGDGSSGVCYRPTRRGGGAGGG